MSRHPSVLLLASWLLVPGLSRAQEELDSEKVARIQREEKAALEKVDKAHGGKKPSEMDNEERRQVIQEQQAASSGVLDKHGVTAKEYARHTATMGREGNAAVAEATKRQEAEEQAKRDAEAKKAEPQEVTIQQGISDKNPVQLEGSPEDNPPVEKGIAAEDQPGADEKVQEQAEKEPKAPRKRRGKGRGGD